MCAGFMRQALRCCSLPQLWQQHLGGYLATAGLQSPPQLLMAATVLVVLLQSSSVVAEAVLTQVVTFSTCQQAGVCYGFSWNRVQVVQ